MNNKPIILIATPLYPPEVGGPATYTKFLEEHLPESDFVLQKICFRDVKHLPYIIRHMVFFWKVFCAAGKADMVYALDPLGVGLPAGLAAKLRGKRFFVRIAGDRAWETALQKFNVTESLDTFSASKKYSFPVRILKRGQACCAKMADKIIVPSGYLKRIVGNWGINPQKIAVVYNAFEPMDISETKEELRARFHSSGTVFMSAGRLVPWKGFEMLIKIMPNFPKATLVIAGDGPEREKLVHLTKELSLQEKVIFLGNISKAELLRRIKASDVFILNTFYEGLSHQLLEAMSVGTPIVSTNVGGNPELIEDGKEGFLVPYNNQKAFLSVLQNPIPEYFPREAKEKLSYFTADRAVATFIKELQK